MKVIFLWARRDELYPCKITISFTAHASDIYTDKRVLGSVPADCGELAPAESSQWTLGEAGSSNPSGQGGCHQEST
jgi:hypothetical protein